MLYDSLVYFQTQVYVPYNPIITYHTEARQVVSFGPLFVSPASMRIGPCQIIFLAQHLADRQKHYYSDSTGLTESLLFSVSQ